MLADKDIDADQATDSIISICEDLAINHGKPPLSIEHKLFIIRFRMHFIDRQDDQEIRTLSDLAKVNRQTPPAQMKKQTPKQRRDALDKLHKHTVALKQTINKLHPPLIAEIEKECQRIAPNIISSLTLMPYYLTILAQLTAAMCDQAKLRAQPTKNKGGRPPKANKKLEENAISALLGIYCLITDKEPKRKISYREVESDAVLFVYKCFQCFGANLSLEALDGRVRDLLSDYKRSDNYSPSLLAETIEKSEALCNAKGVADYFIAKGFSAMDKTS